jgi:hypothetical protein
LAGIKLVPWTIDNDRYNGNYDNDCNDDVDGNINDGDGNINNGGGNINDGGKNINNDGGNINMS